MSAYAQTQDAQLNWKQAMSRNAAASQAWDTLRSELLVGGDRRQRAVQDLIDSQWWDAATTFLSVYGSAPLRLDKSAKSKDAIGLCESLLQISEAAPESAAISKLKRSGRLDQLLRGLCIKTDYTDLAPAVANRLQSLGLSSRLISGGDYWQGSASDFNAMPQHMVHVDDYFISLFPVSQALYLQLSAKNPSRYVGAARPVESLTWFQALQFCNALSLKMNRKPCYQLITKNGKPTAEWDRDADGFRLPTESEWEIAASATVAQVKNRPMVEDARLNFSGSNDIKSVGWANQLTGTRPIGLKAPNAWGLFDCSGNVAEWCWDRFGHYSKQLEPKKKYRKGQSYFIQAKNPAFALGSLDGFHRVYRGGAWSLKPVMSSVFSRMASLPDMKSSSVGFRLASNAPY